MSHLKIIIIKKRDYVQTASAVQQESAGSALYTERCWGAPFPQHLLMPSPTHVTHSFRPSHLSLFSQFSISQGESYSSTSNSVNTGTAGGRISGCSDSPWKGSLRLVSYGTKFGYCGRRKSCLWLVKSNVVTPPYHRQHSGTQGADANSTCTGQRAVPAEFSLAHV